MPLENAGKKPMNENGNKGNCGILNVAVCLQVLLKQQTGKITSDRL